MKQKTKEKLTKVLKLVFDLINEKDETEKKIDRKLIEILKIVYEINKEMEEKNDEIGV